MTNISFECESINQTYVSTFVKFFPLHFELNVFFFWRVTLHRPVLYQPLIKFLLKRHGDIMAHQATTEPFFQAQSHLSTPCYVNFWLAHLQQPYTPPRKLESKNFGDQTSDIHHQKSIANGFPGMCDFKSVHGA